MTKAHQPQQYVLLVPPWPTPSPVLVQVWEVYGVHFTEAPMKNSLKFSQKLAQLRIFNLFWNRSKGRKRNLLGLVIEYIRPMIQEPRS